MAEFTRFGSPRVKVVKTSSTGQRFVDYRDTENLRRMLTPNGKIQSRKRTGLNIQDLGLIKEPGE